MKMQWNVLSEAEVQRIHELSLRILAETGLRITHAGVLRTLRARGARVDEPAERVRFPPELVRELLSQAPPVAVYEGINGRRLPVGGSFLTEDLTIALMRSDEFFESRHFDLSGGYQPDAPGMYEKGASRCPPTATSWAWRDWSCW